MPSSAFGVRSFINILLVMLRLYAKHKDNIEEHFAPALIDALEILFAAYDSIQEANPRGPSKVVPTNIGGSL